MSPEAWAHAREALVFYFSRRHGSTNAEDLAQETLTALWCRDDYHFDKENDFLRVCLGFARRISHEGYRDAERHSGILLDNEISASPQHPDGPQATESRILLEQVCRIGESQLKEKEWQLILHVASDGGTKIGEDLRAEDPNRFRVYLYRARRKLERLTHWHGE